MSSAYTRGLARAYHLQRNEQRRVKSLAHAVARTEDEVRQHIAETDRNDSINPKTEQKTGQNGRDV